MPRSVLVVDDEPNMRWVLTQALEQGGYTAWSAESGEAALALLAREPVDLVLLDLKLRHEDGLGILRRLRERQPELVVIMLTAYGTVATAVEAMQLGAADMLRKPFDVEEILFKIARSLERRAMQQEITRLTVAQRAAGAFESLVGAAPRWLATIDAARHIAATADHVLILGETGSGRRSLARAIHEASDRRTAPRRELDLHLYTPAAQPVALFGATGEGGTWADAGSGSLLLCSLALAPSVQPLLAERLYDGTGAVGPRLLVVAATEDELPTSLLAALPLRLRLPALRERPGDVLLLATQLLSPQLLTAEAAALLHRYHWLGNITELVGTLSHARLLAGAGPVAACHLPAQLHDQPPATSDELLRLPTQGISLEALEQSLIHQAIERAHGNKSKAAELLGLTRHTLVYRMEKYGISAPERS